MSQRSSEAGATRGGEEQEARSLSAPVMPFELAAEAARLRAEQPFAEGNGNARTLVKGWRLPDGARRTPLRCGVHRERSTRERRTLAVVTRDVVDK
jgi:hypothetical protein